MGAAPGTEEEERGTKLSSWKRGGERIRKEGKKEGKSSMPPLLVN